jgi:guanylate kinase
MIHEALRGADVEVPIRKEGVLIIIAGPTSSGKNSVVVGLRERYPDMQQVVSATTRKKRPGEIEGKDYYFISEEEFTEKVQKGEFLEWAKYENNFYGTQVPDLDPVLQGQDLVWIINMGRAIETSERYSKIFSKTLLILIGTPNLLNLRKRFQGRGNNDSFRARLRDDWDVWKQEKEKFPHVIVNFEDKLRETVDQAAQLIEQKRAELK